MRMRDIIGLIFAVIAAIGIAYLTRMFLTSDAKPQETAQVSTQQRILVAAKDLRVGSRLQGMDLQWVEWPSGSLSSSYVQEGTTKMEDVVGSIVRQPVTQGEPLTAGDFLKPGDRSVLSAVVSPNMRAISVDVTAASSSSGLIQPGDYVDLIHTFSVPDPNTRQDVYQATTVANSLKVLAVDRQLDSESKVEGATQKPIPKTITLEVTPSQAEDIAAAKSRGEGTMSLSLVSLAEGACTGPNCNGPLEVKADAITIFRGDKKTQVSVTSEN